MKPKVEISLCMGSSCFSRGNGTLLETLEKIAETRGWTEAIQISGLRCEELCSQGPNVRIDGELYRHMDEGALLDILETKMGRKGTCPSSSVRRSAPKKPARGSPKR